MKTTKLRRTCVAALASLLSTAAAHDSPVCAQQTATGSQLSLLDAVELALDHHPSVQAVGATVDAAAAGLGAAKAAWYPQLGLNASVVRHQEPMVAYPIHAFTPDAVPPFDQTLYGGAAHLGFTLFEGGARTARIRAADAQLSAAAAEQDQTEMAVIARVTAAYLQVQTASGVLTASDRRMAALEAERERVGRLLAEGAAARVESLRVEAALATAEVDRVRAESALNVARLELSRIIGIAGSAVQPELLLTVSLRETAVPQDRSTLLEQATESSPALRRADESLRAAEATHRAAAGAWYPKLDLYAALLGFGYTDDFTTEWQMGARLSYPLFTGGARSSSVARAGAAAEVARATARLVEMMTQDELDRALTRVRETAARVDATTRAVEHLVEVVRIEQLALAEGVGTQTEYLKAEAELFTARSSLVESSHAQIASRVELARVIGELSIGWLNSAVETNP
jgi:outer membrane protein